MKKKNKANLPDVTRKLFLVKNGELTGIMKVLADKSARLRQRFLCEISIMREQPACGRMPAFYVADEHDGELYYVMEKVDPIPEHLPLTEAVSVVRDVAEACQMLRSHKNEYFHAGLNREHIGRRSDGRAVLLGFGLVFMKIHALVAPSTIPGAHYLAPEAMAEGWISEREEVYALGRLLVDLLNDHVPPELKTVVDAATCRDPQSRIQSISEFLVRLDASTLIPGSFGL